MRKEKFKISFNISFFKQNLIVNVFQFFPWASHPDLILFLTQLIKIIDYYFSYILVNCKYSEGHYMKPNADNHKLLVAMGDYLHGVDFVQEKNDRGFNSADWGAWVYVRGDVPEMARVLQKYLNTQLFAKFGLDAAAAIEEGLTSVARIEVAYASCPEITPKLGVQGEVIFSYEGNIPKIAIGRYIDICKSFKLWYDRETHFNYVPARYLNTFNFSSFKSQLEKLGFKVNAMPKIEIASAPTTLTVNEAWAAISRRAPKIFVCKRNGAFFEFRFSFSEKLNELLSNKNRNISGILEVIPGDWIRRTQSLPLALEIIAKARTLVPEFTFVLDDLDAAEKEINEKVEELRKPIPEVYKLLAADMDLFPYQNEFVRFVESSGGNCLIGASMGLGKTLISLSWVASKNLRAVVVGPKVTRRNWCNEAQKFYPGYFDKVVELSPKLKNKITDLSDVRLASVNYSSLSKFIPQIKAGAFDVLIIDESHSIKNPSAQITKTIFEIADCFKHKILLSGTAIKNKKEELFTQIELVRPGMFESRSELKMATIGGTWTKIQDCYKTVSKHEVLKDLPQKISQVVEMEVKDCPDFQGNIHFEEIAEMKFDVAIAKADATIEFLKNALETSDSNFLVFSESLDVVKKIAGAFENCAILHHGQLSDDARERAKDDFQNGKGRILVSTRQSLAVGANLTRADKVVFNDLPFTPADIMQGEDRCHRIGQDKTVNVYWIKAQDNNWDSKVIGILKRKYDITAKVLQGKQVSESERAWLNQPLSAHF